MLIAIDFDGSVVTEDTAYDDLETPLEFVDGVEVAIPALRDAGHTLLLWSARSNRALRFDPLLDPLVRAGVVRLDMDRWRKSQALHVARYQQMLDFVARRCIGWFDAVDDGAAGKPTADLFLDNNAIRIGDGLGGVGWRGIAHAYGVLRPDQGNIGDHRGRRT